MDHSLPLQWKRRILLTALGLLSLACSTLTVTNNSDYELRVQVTMPDGEGPVIKKVAPHGEVDFLSDSGGNFEVTVMASETYIQDLRNQADNITLILFDPRNDLTQGQLSNIVNLLNGTHRKIAVLMDAFDHCIAYAAVDEDTAAVVSWLDPFSTIPAVQCNTQ